MGLDWKCRDHQPNRIACLHDIIQEQYGYRWDRSCSQEASILRETDLASRVISATQQNRAEVWDRDSWQGDNMDVVRKRRNYMKGMEAPEVNRRGTSIC